MEALIGLILLLAMIAIPITLVVFLITFFRKKPSKKWAIACIVSVFLFVVCVLTGGNDSPAPATDDSSEKVVSSEENETEKPEEKKAKQTRKHSKLVIRMQK